MEPGVYEIESKSIFAIIQEYNTKEIKDCVLEGVIYRYSIYNSGCWINGVTTKKNQKQ
jgi:hypothetical protein